MQFFLIYQLLFKAIFNASAILGQVEGELISPLVCLFLILWQFY